MTTKTGGFSRIDTLLSALWVAMGDRSTYVLDEYAGAPRMSIFPTQSFVQCYVDDPSLRVAFARPDSGDARSSPPMESQSRIRIASVTTIVTMVATRLVCEEPLRIELFLRADRGLRASECRGNTLRLEFTSLKHEPRTLRPRSG